MARVQVDNDEPVSGGNSAQDVDSAPAGDRVDPEPPPPRARRRADGPDIEVEREITKRHIIEAVTSIVVVVLYMAFTLFRDRDTGVVVLDERDRGPEDDWQDE